ncbi:MAG: hypothetical protein IPO60_11750 [Flavobacteriales bacterium]|nr:hypothetical protein [Flavobacteriales bacterium]
MAWSTSADENSSTIPEGQCTVTPVMTESVPKPKWALRLLMYLKPSPLRISLICEPSSLVTCIRAPMPFLLLTVPIRFTVSQWLSLPWFIMAVLPLTISRKPSLLRSPMGPFCGAVLSGEKVRSPLL